MRALDGGAIDAAEARELTTVDEAGLRALARL
ncbi:hypothetical protein [Saccharopolyspora gregorii]